MFETHITCMTKDAEKATEIANTFKWKTSQIARDPVLGEDTYFYLTKHHGDLQAAMEDMENVHYHLHEKRVEVIRKKIEAIIYDNKGPAPNGSGNDWKDAVIEACIVSWCYKNEHENNPTKAIADLISWETTIALDPSISCEAQALVDQGYNEGLEAAAKHTDMFMSLADVSRSIRYMKRIYEEKTETQEA